MSTDTAKVTPKATAKLVTKPGTRPKPVPQQKQPVETPVKKTELAADKPAQLTPESPERVDVPAALDKTKRQQTGKLINVNVSAARTRRHLDKLNLNKQIEEELSKLKPHTDAYKEAKECLENGHKKKVEERVKEVVKEDGTKEQVKEPHTVEIPLTEADVKHFQAVKERTEDAHKKSEALSRERVRFSNEAPVALSIIADKLVQQLVNHAMRKVLAAKKKIVQVCHLHEPGVESLTLYPLVKTLPSFVATSKDLSSKAEKLALERSLAEAREQAVKEFKKQYADLIPKKKKQAQLAPEEQPKLEKPEAEDNDDDDVDSKTTFNFYVNSVCKDVIKSNADYANIRISTEIRKYLSTLLIELIQRLSNLVRLTTKDMNIETVNMKAVLKCVKKLLVDGHLPTEAITFKREQVTDPDAEKLEKQKKTEAEAKGLKYKIDKDKLPKIDTDRYVAVRKVTYHGSGYDELRVEVKQKVTLYREHCKPKSEDGK